jgi:hypothetical protein
VGEDVGIDADALPVHEDEGVMIRAFLPPTPDPTLA